MSTEEKQLLLKDLCARLPYNVKCRVVWDDTSDRILTPVELFGFEMNAISEIKPYLHPMSSMSEDEERGFEETLQYTQYTLESYDWLLAHHFDFRGLIEKGLALKAKEGMYRYEISSSKENS